MLEVVMVQDGSIRKLVNGMILEVQVCSIVRRVFLMRRSIRKLLIWVYAIEDLSVDNKSQITWK